jgi:ankyrin repeat protein
MAAKLGFQEICEGLLKAGSDPNVCDFNNKSAIFYSVEHNDIDTVRILIDHGASCNVIDDVQM